MDAAGVTVGIRRRLSRAAVAALLLTLAAVPGAGADQPKPALFLPQLRHDFGKLFEQDKYVHDFVVKNRGNADLVITDVKPTCGCTVAKFDKVIPAGGEGVINLAIEGNQVHGTFSKNATVHSNDPALPVATLTLDGTEIPFIDVEPEDRVYLQGRYGEMVECRLTVRSNEEGTGFQVTGVVSDMDDKITYEVEPGPKPGEFTVTVKKNPELPAMAAVGSLTLRTNSEKAPEKLVQVQVVTKGSITVQPSTVNYGAVAFGQDGAPAEPVQKTVTLLRTEGEFQIDGVEFDSDLYQATVQEVVAGKKYQVDITFRPPVKTESRQREVGEMTIHTNDPTEPLVRVKLVARAM